MKTKRAAKIRHADLFGSREEKYDWLGQHDLANTDWSQLQPSTPFYHFVPRDNELYEKYRRFAGIDEIFPVNSAGIVTARDNLLFGFDRGALLRRIRQLRDPALPDEILRKSLDIRDSRAWRLHAARRELRQDDDWEAQVVLALYRPFDTRWLFYHTALVERGRTEVMRHMLDGENLALCIGRQGSVIGDKEWNLAFCSDSINDLNLFRRGGNLSFPLYLYPEPPGAAKPKSGVSRFVPMLLFDAKEIYGGERQPNLGPAIVGSLTAGYGQPPSPEEILHYVYAVLYAPAYRTKFAEFLKGDFPRIPFTADFALFKKLATLGKRLVGLHLLKSPELDPPTCRFEGAGDNRVGRDRQGGLRYNGDERRIWINATQYFAPVPEAVWNYQIGGYRVCEKWLKDRRECRLELDDIRTYCHIVTALGLTMALQAEADTLYPLAEEALLTITPPA